MSLTPTPAGDVKRPGKTPPPSAPSALFAKRARELQGEAQPPQAYRPPALRGNSSSSSSISQVETAEDGAAAPTTGDSSYSASFRRPRAGTLPSNLAFAAQKYAQPPASSLSTSTTPPSVPGQPQFSSQPLGTTPTPGGGTLTPALRQVIASSNGRNRSGSLTLPAQGLSNAFGNGIFGLPNAWTSSNKSPLRYEELTSPVSDPMGGADHSAAVLDHLGLAEPATAPSFIPATLSELRAQARAQISISRSRASTVSNPYRGTRGSLAGAFLPGSSSYTDDLLNEQQGLADGGYAGMSGGYDPSVDYSAAAQDNTYLVPSSLSHMPNTFKNSSHLLPTPSNRPRATSVGNLLDSPTKRRTSPAAQYVEQTDPYQTNQSLNNLGILKRPLDRPHSEVDLVNLHQGDVTQQQQQQRYLNGAIHSTANTPRAHTPEVGLGIQPQPIPSYPPQPQHAQHSHAPPAPPSGAQIPTRSLWLGSLDPEVTTAELMRIFHVYGAIESLRLLPQKDCAFVNFVVKEDAIRAMEDVRNRLGGRISSTGSGGPVRVGFGKIDSVPLGPGEAPLVPGAVPGAFGGPGGPGSESQTSPTRALWVGSIPSATTPAKMLTIFSVYGPIESVRVLTHKNCAFINFERLDSAVVARKTLNGRDILGPEVGAIRIGFARVPTKTGPNGAPYDPASMSAIGDLSVGASIHALRQVKGASDVPADQQVLGGSLEDYRSNLIVDLVAAGEHKHVGPNVGGSPPGAVASVADQQMVMRILSGAGDDAETEADVRALADFSPPATYYSTIPLINDRSAKRFDAAKLRDIKKGLEACTIVEIDAVANEVMEDAVDLSSDHIGNTVIQTVFERCSPDLKMKLLERIGPHLAAIGCHKNGTWAAQKIISCCDKPEEMAIVAQSLRPYVPALLLEGYGNYVVSTAMCMGAPSTDFIFDAACDRTWEIAQGRFGARSLRTCLDHARTTSSQRKRVAVSLVLNCIPLATSPNGALLITWLVDASALPGRFRLLASRFASHLAHLCTHKLASTAVLRVINQRADLDASQVILTRIFSSPNDATLIDILSDQIHGVNVIQKIITSTALDAAEKGPLIEATKRVLIHLQVASSQSYRRLLEDVGLPHVAPPPGPPTTFAQRPGGRFGPGQSFYPPYGANPGMVDPSLMMGMSNLSMGNTWSPSMTPLIIGGQPSFGQVMGPGGEQFIQGTPPTFSPTSDPFNPFASPPRSEARLPGNSRRPSGRSDRSGSGRSTPMQHQSPDFGSPAQQAMDWQRRQAHLYGMQAQMEYAGGFGQP